MIYGTVTPSALNVQSVFSALFFDIAQKHPDVDLSYSKLVFFRRLHAEKDTFVLSTLPLLGKAVELSLITCEPLRVPCGWKLRKDSRLPVFLYDLFRIIFREDGSLLWSIEDQIDEKVHSAVYLLRQFCLIFSKVEMPETPEQHQKAILGFKVRSTRHYEPDFTDPEFRDVIRIGREIMRRVFSGDSPELNALRRFRKEPWGKHGPGAVAMFECGSQKWDHFMWPGLSSKLFTWSALASLPGGDTLGTQPCARIVTVPKDFRGPRVICVEPKENQFAQQGLMICLYRLLERHPLTRSSICFSSTLASERLCYDKTMSTIDLKDASDTISLRIARLLLPHWVYALVTRYRTRCVTCDGDTWRTTCLASMGNATCFPLETLIFWVISRASMYSVRMSFPPRVRNHLPTTLRVFGDDIIVPTWAFDYVCRMLEASGLVINPEKSCHLSLVKESCGEWVFAGRSSRIVKCKTMSVEGPRSWIQWNEYRRLFASHMPATSESIRLIQLQIFPETAFRKRWNKGLQIEETRVPVLIKEGTRLEVMGYVGLYAWHVHNDLIPFSKGTRLGVKWRWVRSIDIT